MLPPTRICCGAAAAGGGVAEIALKDWGVAMPAGNAPAVVAIVGGSRITVRMSCPLVFTGGKNALAAVRVAAGAGASLDVVTAAGCCTADGFAGCVSGTLFVARAAGGTAAAALGDIASTDSCATTPLLSTTSKRNSMRSPEG